MKFKRLDAAVKASKKHLTDTAAFGTEIEGYLVAYLLVITYAEFEGALHKLVDARMHKGSTDGPVLKFIKSFLKRNVTKLGRIYISDLGGRLERFDTSSKTAFMKEIENQPHHQAWDSILNNRHAGAHPGGQLQMNFNDFEIAYRDSLTVIRAFGRHCGLTVTEINDL